jgi:hypothetical protein
MADLNESDIVQRLRAALEQENAKNPVTGMNEPAVIENLDAELADIPSGDGRKSLRDLVADILAEYPKELPLP